MLENLPVFVATTALMLVVPGPDFVLVTRHALVGGRRKAYRTAAGVCAGLALLTLLTASGLAALLASDPLALKVLRLLGGGYLTVLGATFVVSALRRRESGPPPGPAGARSAAAQGFLNNTLNPKALLFYLTFMPQFLASDRPVFPQALLLGTLVVLCGGVWWGLYITAVGGLGHLLARRAVRSGIDAGAGVALISLGGVFLL